MAQITSLLNGENINQDHQITALARATITPGVISGLEVKDGKVLPGEAFVLCTRSNGEKIMVHFQNTTELTIDTSGTAHIIVEIAQENLDNGALNAEDGSNIGQIKRVSALPTKNFITIASIGGGNITDEREFISLKNIFRKWIDTDWLLVVENWREAVKTIEREAATSEDKILARKANGNIKEVTLENLSEFISGGQVSKYPIVEVPAPVNEKTFSNSSILSTGLNTIIEWVDELNNFRNSSHSRILYNASYKSTHSLHINFINKVKLSKIQFQAVGYLSLTVYINKKLVFTQIENDKETTIVFDEQEVSSIEIIFNIETSGIYLSFRKFLLTGKITPDINYAYSLIESWTYESTYKYTGGETSRYGNVNYGIAVEFPMNVKLHEVKTKTASTSIQARVLVLDNDNRQVGEFLPVSDRSSIFISREKIELKKNTLYKIVCNNAENFWNQYNYVETKRFDFGVNNLCNFFRGYCERGNVNWRERWYEIEHISLEFDSCLVLSRSNLARYNFVWMVRNPVMNQMIPVSHIDGKILGGFEKLQKWSWYYLSNIDGLLSLSPMPGVQKFPIGYAVSDTELKVTTEGSPEHTFNTYCVMGTGDFMRIVEGTDNIALNKRAISKTLINSDYNSKYMFVYTTTPRQIIPLSNYVSVTL